MRRPRLGGYGATVEDPHGYGERLSRVQRELVEAWFPGLVIVADLSWGLVDTTVLRVHHDGADLVVKASGPNDHHLGRGLAAYGDWVPALSRSGEAPHLLHADGAAHLIVLSWLPGHLVLDAPEEHDPATYAAAGHLLRRIHASGFRPDDGHQLAQDAHALTWLDRPHRIGAAQERQVRERLGSPLPGPHPDLVPTHGDWQPRNWMAEREGGRPGDRTTVRVIDFGRADWRPAATDLGRLAVQQLVGRPDLEAAFFEGYGEDPRRPDLWARIRLREAVGTAAWAFQVGDEAFEAQGLRMLKDALVGE